MKKIALMFLGAVFSFLLLANIDEYENLILPLFAPTNSGETFNFAGQNNSTQEIRDTVVGFNDSLSKAYLRSDPSLLLYGPASSRLVPIIAQEIEYLSREGKIMEMKVSDVNIVKVNAISPSTYQVNTKELVKINYLNKGDQSKVVTYPTTEYEMKYIVGRKGSILNVLSFETMSVVR